jgi:hypothetical protein
MHKLITLFIFNYLFCIIYAANRTSTNYIDEKKLKKCMKKWKIPSYVNDSNDNIRKECSAYSNPSDKFSKHVWVNFVPDQTPNGNKFKLLSIKTVSKNYFKDCQSGFCPVRDIILDNNTSGPYASIYYQ